MFFSLSAVIVFFFTLFLVGQAAAGPIPMPMVAAVEGSVLKRQELPNVQTPSKSDGNVVTTYPKRQVPNAQTPSKSDGNAITPYPKRQITPDVQAPAKSDGNVITSYPRSGDIPSQLAVRSVDGVVELY